MQDPEEGKALWTPAVPLVGIASPWASNCLGHYSRAWLPPSVFSTPTLHTQCPASHCTPDLLWALIPVTHPSPGAPLHQGIYFLLKALGLLGWALGGQAPSTKSNDLASYDFNNSHAEFFLPVHTCGGHHSLQAWTDSDYLLGQRKLPYWTQGVPSSLRTKINISMSK